MNSKQQLCTRDFDYKTNINKYLMLPFTHFFEKLKKNEKIDLFYFCHRTV